jgi:hypothetical protein
MQSYVLPGQVYDKKNEKNLTDGENRKAQNLPASIS